MLCIEPNAHSEVNILVSFLESSIAVDTLDCTIWNANKANCHCFEKMRRDHVILPKFRFGQCNLKALTWLCDCGIPETVEYSLWVFLTCSTTNNLLSRALGAIQLSHSVKTLDDSLAVHVPAFLV